ncbi:MAG TPA: AAA family ATPase [Candidatus Limnocylindrales bacterium]
MSALLLDRPPYGRDGELDRIDRWLDRVPAGSAGLLLTGEAGIGKTTLWHQAVARARERGMLVLEARPVSGELPLAFAGLGDLFAEHVRDVLSELPDPQARALRAALGLADEHGPADALLAGRATLASLRGLASGRPVVVAVDDVQWLDSSTARAVAFAVRRLGDAPVGVVASVRAGHADPVGIAEAFGDRLTTVDVGPLSLGALGHLLRTAVDPAIPRRRLLDVAERSGGSPLFALHLAASTAPTLPATLADLMSDRLDAAGPDAEAAIDRVAVLGPVTVARFENAAGLDAAVSAGVLVESGGVVRFAHPLLAEAAYERLPPARRRRLHLVAADAADTIEDQARHMALATDEPHATIARLLDSAAAAATGRGAPDSAADLLAEAVRLTPPADTADRHRRLMDQADCLWLLADEVGARRIVADLLAEEPRGTTRVRALEKLALTELTAASAVTLLEAAVAEPHTDDILATRVRSQLAWQRGLWLGDLDPAVDEAFTALSHAERLGDEATLMAALTTAALLASVAGRDGAKDLFERALTAMERVPGAVGDHTPSSAYAHERWWRGDFVAASALLETERRRVEALGDDGLLLRVNLFTAQLDVRRGRWDDAAERFDAILADAQAFWRWTALADRAILRARRGQRSALDDASALTEPGGPSEPFFPAAAAFARGIFAQAEGRTSDAAEEMLPLPLLVNERTPRGPEVAPFIPEAVAVAVEAGRLADAAQLLDGLERRTSQLEPWGTVAAGLCRGIIATAEGRSDDAAAHLRDAVAGFAALDASWELGQALLAEGRLLRRIGQRRAAASSLERAAAVFGELRAEPAAERAAEELRRARPRPKHDDSLTPAEARVARLVAEGRSNREVAAQLFTTVATVEAHLTRIYSKLGVRSRTQLARRLPELTTDR